MSGQTPNEPRPALTAGHVAAVLAVALLLPIGIVVAILAGAGTTTDDHGPTAVAPLDLESVSPGIAEHYRFAAAHEDELRQVPCFCGCEEFLGHSDLYDCFVRADGAGWDAHAAGCGVCIGEAITARQLLDTGSTPGQVRDAVIEQFGTTPTTVPPS
jgi:hypothetical protein